MPKEEVLDLQFGTEPTWNQNQKIKKQGNGLLRFSAPASGICCPEAVLTLRTKISNPALGLKHIALLNVI